MPEVAHVMGGEDSKEKASDKKNRILRSLARIVFSTCDYTSARLWILCLGSVGAPAVEPIKSAQSLIGSQ